MAALQRTCSILLQTSSLAVDSDVTLSTSATFECQNDVEQWQLLFETKACMTMLADRKSWACTTCILCSLAPCADQSLQAGKKTQANCMLHNLLAEIQM